jgi:hypothetical protein
MKFRFGGAPFLAVFAVGGCLRHAVVSGSSACGYNRSPPPIRWDQAANLLYTRATKSSGHPARFNTGCKPTGHDFGAAGGIT